MTWSIRRPAGAGDRGADRLDERLVVGVAQPPRHERRRAPVLALAVERVRRRADADAVGQHVLPGPRVGAAAGDADRQVLDHGHAVGRGGELQLEHPLQPGVEGDDGAVLLDEGGQRRAARAGAAPRARRASRRRAPRRSPPRWPSPAASAPAPRASGANASPPPWAKKIRMQHLALARPDGVAVDQLAVGQRAARRRPRGRRRRRRAPRRPAGRSGCGSGGSPAGRGWPPAAVGATACSGLTSTKPAPWSAAISPDRRAGRRGRRCPSCPGCGRRTAAPPSPTRAASGSQHRPGDTISRRGGPSGGLQPVVAEREVGGQRAVDVPDLAVLAVDLAPVDLQRVPGPGHDRRPLLEVGRRRPDDLAQPLDGLLRHLVLLVERVQPARVDAPVVRGRCPCHRAILAGRPPVREQSGMTPVSSRRNVARSRLTRAGVPAVPRSAPAACRRPTPHALERSRRRRRPGGAPARLVVARGDAVGYGRLLGLGSLLTTGLALAVLRPDAGASGRCWPRSSACTCAPPGWATPCRDGRAPSGRCWCSRSSRCSAWR